MMVPSTMNVLLVAALGCIAGCTEWPFGRADAGSDAGTTTGCRLPFAGDPRGTPDMELTALTDQYYTIAVVDGGPLPLMDPPQGGRVAFVGVRARNVNPCQARLTGILRDTTTRQVRLDARTVNLRTLDGGIASSVDTNITTWANIPLCPNQWSQKDIHGNAFELQLILEDRDGRRLDRTVLVTPYCAEPRHEAECLCICRGGYTLGEDCTPDGGPPTDGGVDGGDG